ncbi:uncharacterized protein LOC110735868 [Chenopodium quinoa]|uniref:uncharacterized protein LOC110735868 n=1 Tax=Chenopodium quinoa TaxID=63459 RepID=UPI000B773788|nr:uncharacterized protein LOC110735868 [Chenopodium quinoa]
MNSIGDGGFAQGRSANRPPLFCGNNFAHWRSLMQMFVIDQDLELWEIIKKGPKVPMKTTESGVAVPKNDDEFNQTDLESVAKNYRAMNLLYCALDANEFNRVSTCKSAKEIWDKLVVTYEGTSQVKETKISIFLRQYELFKMLSNESIKEMFTRFTQIINNLDSLGRSFSNEEKVRKILRCLPKAKWGPKVTTIEEAQDLRTLPLDDLLGKLITHEMSFDEEDGEPASSTKGLALKAKKEEEIEEDSDEDNDDEDPFALLSRSLTKILKMKKKFSKERNHGKSDRYINRQEKPKGKTYNKLNTLKCYECGEEDHLVRDCPQRKKSKPYKKEFKKKAMVASWSDSDSSDSDNDDQANLCLMAEKDTSKEEHLQVIVNNLMSSPSNILSEFLHNMIINEESLIQESKFLKEKLSTQVETTESLTKEVSILKEAYTALENKVKVSETQIKALKIENNTLKQKLTSLNYCNYSLEKEKRSLFEKCSNQQSLLNKPSNSENDFDKMLDKARGSRDKTGLGFNKYLDKKKPTVFVKAKGSFNGPTCFYCCKKGHTKLTCPFKRKDPHIIKNSFPYFTRDQIKQIWVVKGTRPPNMVYTEYDSKFAVWSRKV